jgi:hypothetical protein
MEISTSEGLPANGYLNPCLPAIGLGCSLQKGTGVLSFIRPKSTSVDHSTGNLVHPISSLHLSSTIFVCPGLSSHILTCLHCPYLSWPVLANHYVCFPVLACSDLSSHILPCPPLSSPVLSCLGLSSHILTCPFLSSPVLAYPNVSFPILACPRIS